MKDNRSTTTLYNEWVHKRCIEAAAICADIEDILYRVNQATLDNGLYLVLIDDEEQKRILKGLEVIKNMVDIIPNNDNTTDVGELQKVLKLAFSIKEESEQETKETLNNMYGICGK